MVSSSSSAIAVEANDDVDYYKNDRNNHEQQNLDSLDSDDFTFSDHDHLQQEFIFVCESLNNLGVISSDDIIELDDVNISLSMDENDNGDEVDDDIDQKTTDGKSISSTKTTKVTNVSKETKDAIRAKTLLEYQKGQQEALQVIVNRITEIEKHTRLKGMKEWRFTIGLVNCLLIAYVFGAYPGYFWILYLVESTFWITSKFRKMYDAKPLSEIFYYFDFCWMMNFLGIFLFTMFAFRWDYTHIAEPETVAELRKQLFLASFGIACGPIFLAAMALPFVAFLFHDTNTMTNLVIHILPSMLNYVLRWQPETMKEAFPNLFDLDYVLREEDEILAEIPFWQNPFEGGSVGRNAIIVYMMWWIPYTVWMLCIGLKLPTSYPDGHKTPKYDTVFHSLWRGSPCILVGKKIWNRPKEVSQEQTKYDNFEIRDFMLYDSGHMIACLSLGIMTLANLAYRNSTVHGCLISIAVCICARRGASRYTYYATAMYGNKIRKEFSVAGNNTYTTKRNSITKSKIAKKKE